MLTEHPKDWLPGLSQNEKFQKLSEITYAQWLTDYAKVAPDALKYLAKASSGYWGYGADGIGAIDAWADGYPGLRRPESQLGEALQGQRAHREAVLVRTSRTSITSPRAAPASLACWSAR